MIRALPATARTIITVRPDTAYRLWFAATVTWLLLGLLLFADVPGILDEGFHAAQILRFVDGRWQQHGQVTMFPGWHAVIALIAGPWTDPAAEPDYPALRRIAMLLALGAVPAAYAVVRRSGGSPLDAMRRTFMFALLPGIAPLLFLLYTDVVALLPVLLAVAWTQSGHAQRSLAAATVATVLRQSNIVWVGWLALRRWLDARESGWRRLVAAWPHLLVLAAFAAFVLVNRGVALGDRSSHPSGHVSLDNLHVGLLFGWVVLLPLQLAATPRIVAGLRSRPLAALPAIALGLAFWFGFAPDHPYNRIAPAHILHNGFIQWAAASGPRLLAGLAMVWSLWTIQFTALRDRQPAALYLTMLLSMLPMWMVEPRYALPALALFLLLREPESPRVETALAIWVATLGIWLTAGYATYTMAL